MQNLKLLSLFIVLASLSGCATYLPNKFDSSNFHPSPILFGTTIDPNFIRIDVARNIRSTYNSSTKITTETPEDYSPLCITFGNGLRLDTNGNLYLSIDELHTLGTSFTLDAASGPEKWKVSRENDHYVSSHSYIGLTSTNNYVLRDGGLYDEGKKRTIVTPIDAGYNIATYSVFGSVGYRQNLTMTNNSIGYRIVEGPDLSGETLFTLDSGAMSGTLKLQLRGIKVQMNAKDNQVSIKYDELLNKKNITVRRNDAELLVSVNNESDVMVKLQADKIILDYVLPTDFLNMFASPNKHVEISIHSN